MLSSVKNEQNWSSAAAFVEALAAYAALHAIHVNNITQSRTAFGGLVVAGLC